MDWIRNMSWSIVYFTRKFSRYNKSKTFDEYWTDYGRRINLNRVFKTFRPSQTNIVGHDVRISRGYGDDGLKVYSSGLVPDDRASLAILDEQQAGCINIICFWLFTEFRGPNRRWNFVDHAVFRRRYYHFIEVYRFISLSNRSEEKTDLKTIEYARVRDCQMALFFERLEYI